MVVRMSEAKAAMRGAKSWRQSGVACNKSAARGAIIMRINTRGGGAQATQRENAMTCLAPPIRRRRDAALEINALLLHDI